MFDASTVFFLFTCNKRAIYSFKSPTQNQLVHSSPQSQIRASCYLVSVCFLFQLGIQSPSHVVSCKTPLSEEKQ